MTTYETRPAASTAASRSRSPPALAFDTEGTIESARKLWRKVDRPNLFVKIPGDHRGLPAIEATLGDGISVNVTLIFGLERYEQVMEA